MNERIGTDKSERNCWPPYISAAIQTRGDVVDRTEDLRLVRGSETSIGIVPIRLTGVLEVEDLGKWAPFST